MFDLTGLRALVTGATGGLGGAIARALHAQGAVVGVSGTRAEALEALKGELGERVHTLPCDLADKAAVEALVPAAEAAMGHIELARWADLLLVAPASADFLARLAAGMADDLLATTCLATTAPIAVAPAMNQQMWASGATAENVATLRARGVRVLGPGVGSQACGEVGAGRMLEPADIAAQVLTRPPASEGPLSGRHVVVTAGPTREPIDPVRFLSNRSSGKMGFAVAHAAKEAGARVTLIAGPVHLQTPDGVDRVNVETAAQMYAAVHAVMADCDVYIGAAAVADYTPSCCADNKIKKTSDTLDLNLEKTPDILASVSALARRPFVVGFAAETTRVEEHALSKLERKKLDLIAANEVGCDRAFDRDDNALLLLWPGGKQTLALKSKAELAREFVAFIAEQIHSRG